MRFEKLDQEGRTATLKFKDGASEIVDGNTALNFHRWLRRLPENEKPIEQSELKEVSAPRTLHVGNLVVTHAMLGRNKAWFYRKDENGREYILAFVNAKGSCSLRTFEAESGIYKGKRYRSGNYEENFPELIGGATELTINNQPNLERDCKERLPKDVLDHLRNQIGVGGKDK